MIFEIQDTIFPNKLKPLKPQPNFDITIKVIGITFTTVRVLSIIFTFIFLNFLTAYRKLLKSEVLNFASSTPDSSPVKNKDNNSKNQTEILVKENSQHKKNEKISEKNLCRL